MAEFVRIPYTQVVIAAIVPAFLFYISVFFSVHWKSAALGYKPIEKDAIPTAQETFIPANVLITVIPRSEEHTSELQSRGHLVCRLLLEKKNKNQRSTCDR